jgi:signal transduction histidine kinase
MDKEIKTLRRLMDFGRQLLSELDPDTVLARILDEAGLVTGAQYVALGVLSEDRTELARFVTRGIDDTTHRAIGDLPHGRGVLGVLISEPTPLRLRDVEGHPHSFGFPVSHPEMTSFLGVPIMIRGEAWGNLYLTEKQNGREFSAADEEAVIVLAQFAATAIENARLYQVAERGRQDLARAVRGLEAARSIADAISAETNLDRILKLIVRRGRALVDARTVLIMLREGPELVVAASAGVTQDAPGHRLPVDGSTSGQVLAGGRPLRIADVEAELRIPVADLGVKDATTALLVPIFHRGDGIGVLAAFDRGVEGLPFTDTDEELLRTFAAAAGNAVALSRSVEASRLRSTIAAAEDERRRWSRELHDQTLQALGGLRVLLSTASRQREVTDLLEAIAHAVEGIDDEIENLRAIISDLRPQVLDDLGIELGQSGEGSAMAPELETTVYRLVQEALTNVVKHARATAVRVGVAQVGDMLIIRVSDDGVGFDPAARTGGFGLASFRERVYLVGGTMKMNSGDGGTTLVVELPFGFSAVPGIARQK